MSRTIPAFLILLLGACSAPAPKASDFDPNDERIKALSKRIVALEAKANPVVELKPTEKEFGLLDTQYGPLAIAVENVRALGNGSEVDLRFGNTTGTSFKSVKYNLTWGSLDEQGIHDTVRERTAARETKTPVLSGSWNTVTVSLPDIPPTKLGYIMIDSPQIPTILLTPR